MGLEQLNNPVEEMLVGDGRSDEAELIVVSTVLSTMLSGVDSRHCQEPACTAHL
jgi:hypothetical protein